MDNDQDELQIPWGVALRLFKPQLLKHLMRDHRLSPKDATDLINNSKSIREERIEQALSAIIKEAGTIDG